MMAKSRKSVVYKSFIFHPLTGMQIIFDRKRKCVIHQVCLQKTTFFGFYIFSLSAVLIKLSEYAQLGLCPNDHTSFNHLRVPRVTLGLENKNCTLRGGGCTPNLWQKISMVARIGREYNLLGALEKVWKRKKVVEKCSYLLIRAYASVII